MYLSSLLATSLALASLSAATPAIYKPRDPTPYKAREPAVYKAREPAVYKAREPTAYKAREPAIYKARESTVYKARDPAIYKARDTPTYNAREASMFKPREPAPAPYMGPESVVRPRAPAVYKQREPAVFRPREPLTPDYMARAPSKYKARREVPTYQGRGSNTYKARQDGCTPDFMGSAMTISAAGQEWNIREGVAAGDLLYTDDSSSTTFFVEQTGQFPTSYIIKPTQDTNLAATVGGNGVLSLQDNDYGNNAHVFTLSCSTCVPSFEGVVASSCDIQFPPSNQCVVPGADPANDPLRLGPCGGKQWTFSTGS